MAARKSVTHWLHDLESGDTAAAQKLWERYYGKLVALAYRRLRAASRRDADEEDVALSAFASFCGGAAQRHFPRLVDRDSLWRLLVVITARKVADRLQYIRRLKRGAGKVRGVSALAGAVSEEGGGGLEQIIGREPTPEFAAQVAEEYQRLLEELGDATLRSIALWKMESYTDDEIAAKLDCSRGTVQRKLSLIRKKWQREVEP